jgi:hypothetical protein
LVCTYVDFDKYATYDTSVLSKEPLSKKAVSDFVRARLEDQEC